MQNELTFTHKPISGEISTMFIIAELIFFSTFFISNYGCLESCPDGSIVRALPGMGWDALTMRETKPVFNFSYTSCNKIDDGKYLIPDNTIAVTIKEKSTRDVIIEHWLDYPLSTSGFEPDVKNEFWPLYYSFSDEYQQMKYTLVANHSIVCRTFLIQYIYLIYTISPKIEIADALKEQFSLLLREINLDQIEKADKVAQSIVKDYGTHYSTAVAVGAILERDDYLRNDIFIKKQYPKNKIASVGKYLTLEDMGFSREYKDFLGTSFSEDYKEALIKRKTKFHGELNWENEENVEHLAIVQRQGSFLSELFTETNFRTVPKVQLLRARQMLNETIRDYFKRNSHYGCTQQNSSNFDFSKNIDDGSCSTPVTNYAFGGMYDVCKRSIYHKEAYDPCTSYNKKNPLTGTNSCPTSFESDIIQTGYHDIRIIHFYSCQSNASIKAPYLFGGVFSRDVNNIHTNNQSCPHSYTTQNAVYDFLKICVSTDTTNELAQRYALPFGGFASLSTEFQCPDDYDRHLAIKFKTTDAVSNKGNIYYCLQNSNIKNLGVVPVLNRPPYREKPLCDLESCKCKVM